MTGSIEIPYAIGTKVWRVNTNPAPVTKVCPECCGGKTVHVTLGNGEEYDLNCRCCSSGYDKPTGIITCSMVDYYPEEMTCETVEIYCGEVRYNGISVERLFLDRAECIADCEKQNVARQEHLETYAAHTKDKARRDLSWSVHYWRRELKDRERAVEVAKKYLGRCSKK